MEPQIKIETVALINFQKDLEIHNLRNEVARLSKIIEDQSKELTAKKEAD